MQPIRIPGTFVVLQGVPGDGASNTIDSLPVLPVEHDTQPYLPQHDPLTEKSASPKGPTSWAAPEPTPNTPVASSAKLSPMGGVGTPQLVPVDPPASAEATTVAKTAISISHALASVVESARIDNDMYVVVSDDSCQGMEETFLIGEEADRSSQTAAIVRSQTNGAEDVDVQGDEDETEEYDKFSQCLKDTLEEWKAECRTNELYHRREWYEQSTSLNNGEEQGPALHKFDGTTATTTPWWMTADGCLAVFDGPPLHVFGVVGPGIPRRPTGRLAPGTVVVATHLVTLRSGDLIVTRPDSDEGTTVFAPAAKSGEKGGCAARTYPPCRLGYVQMVKLESPVHGYCVLSVDGYATLGPGLPEQYCDCNDWYWRVVCSDGAFVRRGLDLSSAHLGTLPYGSIVRVKRKTTNGMALSRLLIEANVRDDDDCRDSCIEGWISEFLNPLSGQRGPIALPLPFPVPALYEVTLAEGAVIRNDVELSSPIIGHAPMGAILTITGRIYSEHPQDQCIARYRLAGNGGWINARLNMHPPDDVSVVKYLGCSSTFDPDKPELFHLASMRGIHAQQQQCCQPSQAASMISSIDDDEEEDDNVTMLPNTTEDFADALGSRKKPPPCTYSAPSTGALRRNGPNSDDRCLICLCEDRTATIVHGETGHIACCLVCARILKARGDPCPVCRLSIDLVVQHFWA